MIKLRKSLSQMTMSFREIALTAAQGNEDIRKALLWVDARHEHSTFGTANGTVRDHISVLARPREERIPIAKLGYGTLWHVFMGLICGPDSQEVKDVFVPVLALSLAYQTKRKAKAGETLGISDMVCLMDITNKKRKEGMFTGEGLGAVNYMMRTTAKQSSREVKAERGVNEPVCSPLPRLMVARR